MDKWPLVSILMTAYNREEFISQAIESVIASNYENWELLIADDCSSDSTYKIAEDYKRRDSRIRVIKNEYNLGDYPNRNNVATYARGKYLKYLDADDLIYPYGLFAMVSAMELFPTAGFALSYWVIDDEQPYPQFFESRDIIRNEYLNKSLLAAGPSASIIKTEVFKNIGGFSGKQYIGDTELWLKVASKYPMVKMAPALVWYRRHPDQQISQERKNFEVPVLRHKISLKYLEKTKHFFSVDEYKFAQKKLIRNFSRASLKDFFSTLDFKRYMRISKGVGFDFFDMLSGFKPYLHKFSKN
jgi:glycosyltransferase involved in cell wall biosynthesis